MTDEGRRKVALVTGGARGIGRAIAENLAARDFCVVVNDLPGNSRLDETVAAIAAHGGSASALTGDISAVEQHEALVAQAWDRYGGIDCLVNNAGISVKVRGDLLDVSPESFDRLVAVNLRGAFFLTQAVARRMLAAPQAGFRSVITISSANAVAASVDRGEYCISKAGLAMMNKLFAIRLAEAGINTYEIRPGVIRTDMTAVARARYDARFAQGLAPINRWGEPGDIGSVVAALASGSMAYVTGEAVHVDGGLLVSRL